MKGISLKKKVNFGRKICSQKNSEFFNQPIVSIIENEGSEQTVLD
jgi:hypothetical protein